MSRYIVYKLILITLVVLPTIGVAQQRIILGQDNAKHELSEALNNKRDKQVIVDAVIKDKSTAVSIAEPMLFNIYGKTEIINERPYEI